MYHIDASAGVWLLWLSCWDQIPLQTLQRDKEGTNFDFWMYAVFVCLYIKYWACQIGSLVQNVSWILQYSWNEFVFLRFSFLKTKNNALCALRSAVIYLYWSKRFRMYKALAESRGCPWFLFLCVGWPLSFFSFHVGLYLV